MDGGGNFKCFSCLKVPLHFFLIASEFEAPLCNHHHRLRLATACVMMCTIAVKLEEEETPGSRCQLSQTQSSWLFREEGGGLSTANQRDFIRLSSWNNPHKPHTRRHEDELKICESIKTLKWTGRDGLDWPSKSSSS